MRMLCCPYPANNIPNNYQKWASQTVSRFLSPLPDGRHSSRTIITNRLKRPTRKLNGAGSPSSPIWSCSAWGLPCQTDRSVRGAFLPHLFTLTDAETPAVYFLWHFPQNPPFGESPRSLA